MNTTVASAYMIGGIILVVFLLLAVLVANGISFETGINREDKKKRRTWFWVLAVLCPIAVMAVSYFAVYTGIRVPSRQTAYITAMGISSAAAFVLYVAIGYVLSKMFPHGKLSSWF